MIRSRGFSLIEIMVVLGLISILTTLAWPSWDFLVKRYQQQQIKTAFISYYLQIQQQRELDSSLPSDTSIALLPSSVYTLQWSESSYGLTLTAFRKTGSYSCLLIYNLSTYGRSDDNCDGVIDKNERW